MGCYIRGIIEVKINNRWVEIDRDYSREFFNFKNYYIYSVLANVRNSDGIKPISEPRGFPDDTYCMKVLGCEKEEAEMWDSGYHSFSWVTLKELLEYPWRQVFEDNVDWFLEKLKDLEDQYFIKEFREPEDIRLVFAFDD